MPQIIKPNLFDSHTFIKQLVESGMPEKQAEVLAEQQKAILETQVATRADIYEVKTALENKIQSSTNKILSVVAAGLAFLAIVVVCE